MRSVLIVGGAGFIGSRLALRIRSQGMELRILDDFSSGRIENLAALERQFQLVRGDMRDAQTLHRAISDVDGVVLLAAIPSVVRSTEDPVGTNDVNVNGTLAVLEAAREASVERLVFASSAAVYGRSPDLPKRESQLPAPASPYGVHKLTGEHYCRVFRELYGLSTVSLRFFNVFGPHQNLQSEYASAIPKFLRLTLGGERPIVFGTGYQTRDFVYVENVVDAIVLALTAPDPGPGPFNVGTGRSTTVLELLELIMRACGRRVEIEFQPPRPGDVMASQADIGLARERLRYEPRMSIDQGLAEMAEWIRREPGFLEMAGGW